MDLELFIWKQVGFNLHMPIALRYFERFARCAFAESPTKQDDFNLGLYLIFIASQYPGLSYSYSQAVIAASAVHSVLRIRENQWTWTEYLRLDVCCGIVSDLDLKCCTYRLVKKFVGLITK